MPTRRNVSVEPIPETKEYRIEIQPNPVEQQMKIIVDVPNSGMISVEIYNTIGQKIYEIPIQYYTKGQTIIPVESSQFPIGAYFCKATALTETITTQFVVVR